MWKISERVTYLHDIIKELYPEFSNVSSISIMSALSSNCSAYSLSREMTNIDYNKLQDIIKELNNYYNQKINSLHNNLDAPFVDYFDESCTAIQVKTDDGEHIVGKFCHNVTKYSEKIFFGLFSKDLYAIECSVDLYKLKIVDGKLYLNDTIL